MPILDDFLGIGDNRKHYYGDVVRTLFFVAGLVMLTSLPFYKDVIPFPIMASVLTILLLDLVAGTTNPVYSIVVFMDTMIAIVGFLIFEYYAVTIFTDEGDIFFLINQSLAIIFFFALYFSTKSLRGRYVRHRDD